MSTTYMTTSCPDDLTYILNLKPVLVMGLTKLIQTPEQSNLD